MKILSNKEYKELKEAKEFVDTYAKREQMTNRLLKVDCCDVCFHELIQYERENRELEEPALTLSIQYKTIRLCATHFYALQETINKTAEEEREYLQQSLQEEKIHQEENAKIIDFGSYHNNEE